MTRSKSMLVVVAIFLLLLGVSETRAQGTQWDYLTFVAQWGPSLCARSASGTCEVPSGTKEWTIHGLWPSVVQGTQPADCPSSALFNDTAIVSLLPQLNLYWPTFMTHNTNEDFWKHEYEKHGTCAQDLPSLAGTYNYLHATLQLHAEYDVNKILKKAGVVATSGREYSSEEIARAMIEEWDVEPVMVCGKDRENPQASVLYEIRMCINKQLKVIQCDTSVYKAAKTCPPLFYVAPTSGDIPTGDGDDDGTEVAIEVIFPLMFVGVVLAIGVATVVGVWWWRRRQRQAQYLNVPDNL